MMGLQRFGQSNKLEWEQIQEVVTVTHTQVFSVKWGADVPAKHVDEKFKGGQSEDVIESHGPFVSKFQSKDFDFAMLGQESHIFKKWGVEDGGGEQLLHSFEAAFLEIGHHISLLCREEFLPDQRTFTLIGMCDQFDFSVEQK